MKKMLNFHFDSVVLNEPDNMAVLRSVMRIKSDQARREWLYNLIGATYEDVKRAAHTNQKLAGLNAVKSLIITSSFVDNGQQKFVLGQRMCEMFSLTRLDGINLDDIRLPFPTFYVHFDADLGWKIWGGNRTHWHTVRGAYVCEMDYDLMDPSYHPPHRIVNVQLWGEANEKSRRPGDDATYWMPFIDSLIQKSGAKDLEGYLDIKLSQPVKSGRLYGANFLASPSAEDYEVDDSEETAAAARPSVEMGVRVILNLLLYLSSENPELRRERFGEARVKSLQKKMRRAKKKRREEYEGRISLAKSTVTYVGESIESEFESMQTENSERAGIRRHIVRGHWHTYRVGPGRAKKTRKWIKPFWRGHGETLHKHYSVVEPEVADG